MDLGSLVRALAGDVALEASKGAAGALVEAALKQRRRAAADLLIVELRKGNIPLVPPDEAISAVLRYIRAADEGSARLNLRLMARVIAGKAFLGNLKADEFLYYAEALASLRREEIVLLATIHRIKTERQARDPNTPIEKIWNEVVEALVPSLFATEPALRGSVMGCLRTGLLVDINSNDDAGYYVTSPLMDELEALAPFEVAIHEEELEP